jgi:undecaprenyl diphosphate synthase
MQSTQYPALHVAIIMDGNGRWATERGLPRVAGHKEGSKAVRRTVEAAPALGIGTLTLCFSSDNWHARLKWNLMSPEEHLQRDRPRIEMGADHVTDGDRFGRGGGSAS